MGLQDMESLGKGAHIKIDLLYPLLPRALCWSGHAIRQCPYQKSI